VRTNGAVVKGLFRYFVEISKTLKKVTRGFTYTEHFGGVIGKTVGRMKNFGGLTPGSGDPETGVGF